MKIISNPEDENAGGELQNSYCSSHIAAILIYQINTFPLKFGSESAETFLEYASWHVFLDIKRCKVAKN
jgi:hypothetical protein